MKRVLITGMSGTGKSAVIEELIARGYRAHDLGTLRMVGVGRSQSIGQVDPGRGSGLGVARGSGSAPVIGASGRTAVHCRDRREHADDVPVDRCDHTLTAPLGVLMDRLAARPTGGYGHSSEDRQKVIDLISTVEPLLREVAHLEIDTQRPIQATVEEILRRA